MNKPSSPGQRSVQPSGGRGEDKASDPSLRIEFFGMPGVGKSVIAEALVGSLVGRGVKARCTGTSATEGGLDRLLRVGGRLRRAAFALKDPGSFRQQVSLVLRSRQVTADDFARVLLNWLVVLDEVRVSRSFPGVVVSDQGVVQGVWSILLRSRADRDDELARELLRGCVLPEVLVVVRADSELTERRRRKRPGVQSRMERIVGVRERGEDLFRRVDRITRSLDQSPRVLDVYNGPDDTPKAKGDALATALSDWVVAPGTPRLPRPSLTGRGGSSEPNISPCR